MGDGAAGRSTVLTGTGFVPNATYSLYFGGYPGLPTAVTADGTGAIPATSVALPPLPAGFHDVFLSSLSWSVSFTGAYRVVPNICVSPIVGDGRAGQTWLTNPAMRPGSWVGMVLSVDGTGFTAGSTVLQDSITVGGMATRHPERIVPASGILQSTTLIVASNMPNGSKDIVINDGTMRTFAGAYAVRRSLGMSPARGSRKGGTQVTVEGWGFTNGNLVQVRIGGVLANFTAPVAITNGHFTAVTTLAADIANGFNDVIVNDGAATTFPGTYMAASNRYMALSPVSFSGAPNQAFLVRGISGFANGDLLAMGLYEGNTLRSAVSFPATTVTGGGFGSVWAAATGPVPVATDQFVVTDAGGAAKETGIDVQRAICLCPVTGNGSAGWTVSVTGFGFAAATTLDPGTAQTITVGGATTLHATTTITDGSFGPLAATIATPLDYGTQNVEVRDALFPATFMQAFTVWRSIGLSAVVGKGSAGETTAIMGTGFIGGSVFPANSISFGGSAATHPLMTVLPSGSFGPVTLNLPALTAGPKNVSVPAQEVFPQAYRVCDPVVSVSKYRAPGSGLPGTVVTWSFSFTNTGYAGEPAVAGMVLLDTIPAGLAYNAGSTTSTLPSAVGWYHSGCACWTSSDLPAADVVSIRWTLTSPLPSGASGYAGFRATVQ